MFIISWRIFEDGRLLKVTIAVLYIVKNITKAMTSSGEKNLEVLA